MTAYFIIPVEDRPDQFHAAGTRFHMSDHLWSTDGDPYTDARYHLVQTELAYVEDGPVPIPQDITLKNVRGIEWEDFPDYGGWDASDDEPKPNNPSEDYHEWVSYRAWGGDAR